MQGISIGRGDARSVGPRVQPVAELRPNSQSDFDDFFSPLYPLLDDFSWLVDKAKFWFPDDLTARRFKRDVIAHHGDCLYFAAGSLRRWAQYLYDDWCSVVGFRTMADDPGTLVKASSGRLTDAYIQALTPAPDCVFHCVDAARWTFYARDERLLTTVREHVASRTGLRVRDLVLGGDVT